MTRTLNIVVVAVVLGALAATPLMAQGWGRAQGYGYAWGGCPRWGAGGGWGGGGWWTRVQPQTEEQQQYVAELAELHNQIRARRVELWAAQTDPKQADRAAKLQEQITDLQARVHKLMLDRTDLQLQMVPAAPQCPWGGNGPGWGGGWGRGMGMGRGMGRGLNPYCPYR